MTQRLLAFPLFLLLASKAPAQTPTALAQPAQTIRANTRLVIVDVVVTDSKQNPVQGLKASDFTLLEKGQPQTINHFEEHTALTDAAAAKLPPVPRLQPGIFTNYSPTPASGALNILLLDALNTPLKDQAVVRQEMLKYLKSPRPGVRMAIFGLGSRLHLLQGFTSDPDLLAAVLSGKKGSSTASPLMDNAVTGDTVGQERPLDAAIDNLGNTPGGATVAASIRQFEAEQQSIQTMLRTRYTLDALNLLGRYLSGLPGRKNLIWFSGSFPVNILPDGDLQTPFAIEASMADEFRDTINLLSRSQVSVYPIDARGLMTAPMYDAGNSGAKYGRNPSAHLKDLGKFLDQTASEHGTMLVMAEETGGKAFINTNGLKEAVGKAIDAGSNFYTLTYSPTNRDSKGDFRKIQVALARSGYTLAYRRGYYADDPDSSPTRTRNVAATTPTSFDPFRTAMQWGGPDPTEILFEASVLPTSEDTETTLAPGNKADPKTAGPYRRYNIVFSADPRAITATATDKGEHHFDMQFLAFVYNNEGALVTSTGKHVVVDLPAAQYANALHTGVRSSEQISVPAKGEYYLRLGIQDVPTAHVGAIELPISAVSRLKPPPPPPAPPPPIPPAQP